MNTSRLPVAIGKMGCLDVSRSAQYCACVCSLSMYVLSLLTLPLSQFFDISARSNIQMDTTADEVFAHFKL